MHFSEESTGIFESCTFDSNEAGHNDAAADASTGGGSIGVDDSTVEFAKCVFYESDSRGSGGALYLYASVATFTMCTFDSCGAALTGGAVYSAVSTANFDLCDFTSNQADEDGGVAYGAGFVFNNCSMTLNRAQGRGGVVYGGATFSASSFTSNSASSGGVAYATSTTSMTDSVVTNGDAGTEGAVIYSTSSVEIRRATIEEVGSDDASSNRRRRTALTDEPQHVFYHAASNEEIQFVMDTVVFRNNTFAAIGSEGSANNVISRNCEGLAAGDVVGANLMSCDDNVGAYCSSVDCTDVATGIEVSLVPNTKN